MVGMEQLDHGTVHEKIKERKRKGKKGRKEEGKQREKKKERPPSLHFITRSETGEGLRVPEILKIYLR